MAQTLRIKTAGGLTKMSLSPRIKRSDGYQTRREKKRISSAAQKYINAKAQHSQLEFLLAANIRPGDWFLTLTNDDQHLPDSWDGANKQMQYFCRKVRDSHPKFLLTLDEDPNDNFDGIRKLNALDWLLQ